MRSEKNLPSVPVSWGELIDKLTILEIKAARLTDKVALGNVARERDILASASANQLSIPKISECKAMLIRVNELIWETEDAIRDKERLQQFDEDFVALARAVYFNNDKRAAIKREINIFLESALVEEKSYKAY